MTQALILLAHGSRDPMWKLPMDAIAERIRLRAPNLSVACAYLELCAPTLAQCASELIAMGADSLCVLPVFLGLGQHARMDIPQRMQALRLLHPGVALTLAPAMGEMPGLQDAIADLALKVVLPLEG